MQHLITCVHSPLLASPLLALPGPLRRGATSCFAAGARCVTCFPAAPAALLPPSPLLRAPLSEAPLLEAAAARTLSGFSSSSDCCSSSVSSASLPDDDATRRLRFCVEVPASEASVCLPDALASFPRPGLLGAGLGRPLAGPEAAPSAQRSGSPARSAAASPPSAVPSACAAALSPRRRILCRLPSPRAFHSLIDLLFGVQGIRDGLQDSGFKVTAGDFRVGGIKV